MKRFENSLLLKNRVLLFFMDYLLNTSYLAYIPCLIIYNSIMKLTYGLKPSDSVNIVGPLCSHL
jgi:hypothetical protein